MSALANPRYTPEQYLEIERNADYKSEYLSGEMFAMAGSTEQHALITWNISGELRSLFKGRPCKAYSPDLRVQVTGSGLYTYPDVVVLCGKPRFADSHLDTLLNPNVIVEVLSPSTEAFDRGEKFAHYRKLDTLTDYILVAQDKVRVEHFVRQPNNDWLLHAADGLEEVITLESIDCRLSLSEIYDKVSFDVPPF